MSDPIDVPVDLNEITEAAGCEPLTPQQEEMVAKLVQERLPHEVRGEPVEAWPVLTYATAAQVTGEVLGVLPPTDAAGKLALGEELTRAGADEINRAVTAGNYSTMTEDQRQHFVRSIPLKVQGLLRDGVPPDRAREAVREYARTAVRVVLGTPPHMH